MQSETTARRRSTNTATRKRKPHWECSSSAEEELRARGYAHVAGADEVGRGCLFGPVVAAAVILSPEAPIPGLNDSKQVDPAAREELAGMVRARAVGWAIAAVDACTIDQINIYQASRLAMKNAVLQLNPAADYVLVDALQLDIATPQEALIQGDERCHAIAAASIIAKVYRDELMREWDRVYPEFGFANHKGYQTPQHLAALQRLGPTPLHRFSFEPVRLHSFEGPAGGKRQMEMFAA